VLKVGDYVEVVYTNHTLTGQRGFITNISSTSISVRYDDPKIRDNWQSGWAYESSLKVVYMSSIINDLLEVINA